MNVETIATYMGSPLPRYAQSLPQNQSDIEGAAVQFEAYFLKTLLTAMRKTVPSGGLFGGGAQSATYQALFDEALADTLAAHGGIGLASILKQNQSDRSGAGPLLPEALELDSAPPDSSQVWVPNSR